jgi:hypothetical protein
MGNKQPNGDNPWASVAKATTDTRSKEQRAVNGASTAAAEVQTTATKLPGSMVYSTVKLVGSAISFEVLLLEPCKLEVSLNEDPAQVMEKAFEAPGSYTYTESLKIIEGENRVDVSIKSLGNPSKGSLRVTLMIKSGRVVILRKQAEVDGNLVTLEEIFGIGSAKECVVCLVETSDTTFVPCRHMCTCNECASMLMAAPSADRKCPVCRSLVAQMVKVKSNS